jgi:hypothetical protein
MRVFLIVLLFVAVALVATNPGPESFERFVREHAARQIEAQNLPGGGLLGQLGGGLLGQMARQHVERDNYLLFSVYTLDLDGPQREGEEWRFLGIGTTFLELQRPESLRER